MTITITDLISQLRSYAPMSIELPRDRTTNEEDATLPTRWAADAAQMINEATGQTTVMETTVTIVADTHEYDLPADCREVTKIDRKRGAPISDLESGADIPDPDLNAVGLGGFGHLPSGQEVDLGISTIALMQQRRQRREDQYELIGTQIRFLFPMVAGEVIRLTYRVVDRTLASLSDDKFTLVLTKMLIELIQWWTMSNAGATLTDGDGFIAESMGGLMREKARLEGQWNAGLQALGREIKT